MTVIAFFIASSISLQEIRGVVSQGLFTMREGYPRERVNPSWRVKDGPGLQAKFHR